MDLCSENNTIQSVVIKALSMLPYTELLDVACVCKSWRNLRTSKGFRNARKAVDEHALVVTNWEDDATYLSVYALCGGCWHKMAVNHAQAYGRSSRPLLVIGAVTSFRGELFELGWVDGDGGPWGYGGAFNIERNDWRYLEWCEPQDDRKVRAATSNDSLVVVRAQQSFNYQSQDFALKYYKPGMGGKFHPLPAPPFGSRGIRREYSTTATMCLVGDVLYLAGGIESDEGDVDRLPWPASARLQALDLKTLEWTLSV